MGKKKSKLGLYPIINKRLKKKYNIVQFREKNLLNLYTNIRDIIINDFNFFSIKNRKLGFHLGIEDLRDINTFFLYKKAVVIGISSHDLYELSLTKFLSNFYIAIGPVLATKSKDTFLFKQGFFFSYLTKILNKINITFFIGGLVTLKIFKEKIIINNFNISSISCFLI